MGKNVGLTYGEFTFPAEQGFSGSAGVHKVTGYMRGGRVKGKSRAKMPANVKGHGGSVHDKLKHEGGKMGYAYGGQVKNTSSEFVAKRGKQDTMDHGVQPAQKGRNQAEIEAGGNKRLKAGYGHGGGVHRVRAHSMGKAMTKGLKKLKGVMSEGDRAAARRIAAGKNMPKNVKAKGGLAKYAAGGAVKKAGAALLKR